MENKKPNEKSIKNLLEVDEETVKILKSIDKRLKKFNSFNLPVAFVRGLFTGLGFVFGTTVLLAFTILVLRQFITVPVVGGWVSDIINVVERK
ncbi:MAG: DUF5665 domain-containing protein [Candidatus Dojkabacteria bacterium]